MGKMEMRRRKGGKTVRRRAVEGAEELEVHEKLIIPSDSYCSETFNILGASH